MAKTIIIKVSNNTLLYSVIGVIVVALLALNAYAFLRPSDNNGGNAVEKTAENFNAFKAAENPIDKCATPSGYTDEEWKEHMGHHPDQYKECL